MFRFSALLFINRVGHVIKLPLRPIRPLLHALKDFGLGYDIGRHSLDKNHTAMISTYTGASTGSMGSTLLGTSDGQFGRELGKHSNDLKSFHRWLHPPAASTSCIHQLHPPAASTSCIHQLHPPAASTSCIHQLHPPAAYNNSWIEFLDHDPHMLVAQVAYIVAQTRLHTYEVSDGFGYMYI
jgi:hypothetical protein